MSMEADGSVDFEVDDVDEVVFQEAKLSDQLAALGVAAAASSAAPAASDPADVVPPLPDVLILPPEDLIAALDRVLALLNTRVDARLQASAVALAVAVLRAPQSADLAAGFKAAAGILARTLPTPRALGAAAAWTPHNAVVAATAAGQYAAVAKSCLAHLRYAFAAGAGSAERAAAGPRGSAGAADADWMVAYGEPLVVPALRALAVETALVAPAARGDLGGHVSSEAAEAGHTAWGDAPLRVWDTAGITVMLGTVTHLLAMCPAEAGATAAAMAGVAAWCSCLHSLVLAGLRPGEEGAGAGDSDSDVDEGAVGRDRTVTAVDLLTLASSVCCHDGGAACECAVVCAPSRAALAMASQRWDRHLALRLADAGVADVLPHVLAWLDVRAASPVAEAQRREAAIAVAQVTQALAYACAPRHDASSSSSSSSSSGSGSAPATGASASARRESLCTSLLASDCPAVLASMAAGSTAVAPHALRALATLADCAAPAGTDGVVPSASAAGAGIDPCTLCDMLESELTARARRIAAAEADPAAAAADAHELAAASSRLCTVAWVATTLGGASLATAWVCSSPGPAPLLSRVTKVLLSTAHACADAAAATGLARVGLMEAITALTSALRLSPSATLAARARAAAGAVEAGGHSGCRHVQALATRLSAAADAAAARAAAQAAAQSAKALGGGGGSGSGSGSKAGNGADAAERELEDAVAEALRDHPAWGAKVLHTALAATARWRGIGAKRVKRALQSVHKRTARGDAAVSEWLPAQLSPVHAATAAAPAV